MIFGVPEARSPDEDGGGKAKIPDASFGARPRGDGREQHAEHEQEGPEETAEHQGPRRLRRGWTRGKERPPLGSVESGGRRAPRSEQQHTSNFSSQQSKVDIVIDMPSIVPIGIPDIDLGRAPIDEGQMVIGHGGIPGRTTTGAGSELGSGSVIDEAAVDRAPNVLGNAPEPRYPAVLRSNGTSGHVVVRFVVDTTGRAEMDRLTVVESTHPLFVDAVRNALANYRFSAGEVAGRKVRTLVQMPFAFQLR